jgi:beta-galactosidase
MTIRLRLIPTLIARVFILITSTTIAQADNTPYWPDTRPLNTHWTYHETATTTPPQTHGTPVTLPHTWNALDTLAAKDYRRDASWYTRTLTLSTDEPNRRVYLRCKAAGNQAELFVNGQRVGEHLGGYTAFAFEITPFINPGDNTIALRVSNAPREDLPPLDIDHNIYGGLYRSVELLLGPPTGIARTELGGPGIYARQLQASHDAATLSVTPILDNALDHPTTLDIIAELRDHEGRVVSHTSATIEADPGRTELPITMPPVLRPRLWSPADPYLYTLRVEVWDERNLADTVTLRTGFRFFDFDPNGGFSLNGQPLTIRGVNRHQDVYRKGAALTEEDHRRDMHLIAEVGANAVRLAHYPQDDAVLDLADTLGLLVWEEIPLVNMITPTEAFRDNTMTMLREMIAQHMHHPSIIIWGLANELLIRRQDFVEEKNALVADLHAEAKRLDPSRPTAVACHGHADYTKLDMTGIADIVGYNLYFGWYSNTFADLTPILAGYRAAQSDKPHIVSEYGAGSDLRIQRTDPKRFDFSEQWQCDMIESYLDQFEDTPWLNGSFYWNMFDFGASHRGDSIPAVNQKGLITFDRQTKKDAFYLVQSRWSDKPMLYLASPRHTARTGPATQTFKVYTNLPEVTLTHNGTRLPTRSQGQSQAFTWDITLTPGENTLLAEGDADGETISHGYAVIYSPESQTTDAP